MKRLLGFAPCKGIWISKSGNFAIEIRDPGFGIRNSTHEIWNPTTIGIKNPSSTDKDWKPVPGIRNPMHGIQNPRLFSIPLHEAIDSESFSSTPNSNKRKKGRDCGDHRKLFLDRRLCVEIILKITDNFSFISFSLSLFHSYPC